jgi:WD40 repeat protein
MGRLKSGEVMLSLLGSGTRRCIGEDGFEFDDEEGGGLNIDSAKRDAMGKTLEPTMSYTSKNGFNGIDHHRTDGIFATASNTVQIWDETRSSPMSTLAFGSSMETVSGVKFNQSETSVLASIGNDRTMCLYDIRTGKAERRIMMQVSVFQRQINMRLMIVPFELFIMVSYPADCIVIGIRRS